MDYVYNIFNNVKYFYSSMNPAVLSGAIDVVVVEQPDGTYRSTPFHVRFGRYGVFNYDDKYVDMKINGAEVELKMKLGENGVAFFVEANPEGARVPRYMATSPLNNDVAEERRKPSATSTHDHAEKPTTSKTRRANHGLVQRRVTRRHSTANEKSTKKKRTLKHRRMVLQRSGIHLGSYSDSECYRRRKTNSLPKIHSEWKWGEIPILEKNAKLKTRTESKSPPTYTAIDVSPTAKTMEGDDKDLVELIFSNYKRSLRLSNKQLRELGLQYGANEARFSVTTRFQGTAWCVCQIYLLKWTEHLVVSDIDGTITKNDVLGHVIAAIGGTWAHAGVAELFAQIADNGYRMIYLSSRTIGMSGQTKQYLKTIKQGTKSLPDGPVLLSPTSVLMALRREVIQRRPEQFKIACLTDLKKLFPDRQPFFAGFGNRITDVESYQAVDIPPERIFIIDSSGVVVRADDSYFTSNYSLMATGTVDFMFPPLFQSKFSKTHKSLREFIRPEDIFYSCCSWDRRDSSRNAYYNYLTNTDAIAAYTRRCAELSARKKTNFATKKAKGAEEKKK